ncbi:hypothetical protein AVEN_20160-1 [Araneus ventricosus]|uniref:Uncharacterized protein n=1 Tax=Araneus ventricosus TaxID=182803 RepID=A0A4Y2RY83_ARAVE|nr:hypothetical protein AVEN_20160-1 [Araneus ventricosus]
MCKIGRADRPFPSLEPGLPVSDRGEHQPQQQQSHHHSLHDNREQAGVTPSSHKRTPPNLGRSLSRDFWKTFVNLGVCAICIRG